MSYLPLAPSGTTPLRVLTIAGSDSGGGAGVQADIRTCTLLGVHTLCAVTAVTVQNSVGVKDFHKTPPDVVAAQIAADTLPRAMEVRAMEDCTVDGSVQRNSNPR